MKSEGVGDAGESQQKQELHIDSKPANTAGYKYRKKSKDAASSILEPGPGVILLKGLVKKTTKETLTEIFSAFGTITYLKLPFSNQKKRNQGFAYIRFESDEVGQYLINVKKSIEINGKLIKIWPHSMDTASSNSGSSLGEKESPQSKKISRRSLSDMSQMVKKILVRGRSEPSSTRFPPSLDHSTRVTLSSRWELHDFKPTNSIFYWIHRGFGSATQDNNLLYRVVDDRERGDGPDSGI